MRGFECMHIYTRVLYVTCCQSHVFEADKMIFMHVLMAQTKGILTKRENERAEVEQEKW